MIWQEPNCDMDLEIYKDWLYEFNETEDLREIPIWSLVSYPYDFLMSHQVYNEYDVFYPGIFEGLGDGSEDFFYDIQKSTDGDGEMYNYSSYINGNFVYSAYGDGYVHRKEIFCDSLYSVKQSLGDGGIGTNFVLKFLGCGA